ncbi:hypothetical protein MBRA_00788 [Methylobacterium brachiatum]|nr:hypothetical protein MBRA_00788 [Methylobacterium brachiatum]
MINSGPMPIALIGVGAAGGQVPLTPLRDTIIAVWLGWPGGAVRTGLKAFRAVLAVLVGRSAAEE